MFYTGRRRRLTGVADRSSLTMRGKEGGPPVIYSAMRECRTNRYERRQVLVLTPQAIGNPRTETRSYKLIATGMQFQKRSAVRRIGTVNRSQNAQVVYVLRDMWKQFTHRQTTLAMLMELPRRFQQSALLGKRHIGQGEWWLLAVVAIQQRFWIEGIHMRRPTFHKQEHNPLS